MNATESGPARPSGSGDRPRTTVRLTRFGLKALVFYFVLVLAFYAMPYSNPFFLLLGFATLLGVLGTVAARRNLGGVTAAAAADLEPVAAGAPVRVPAEVRAARGLRLHVGVELELAGGGRLVARVAALDGRAAATLESPALARGVHRVVRAHVESTHPFGLVHVRRAIPAPRELVCYPAPRGRLDGRSAESALDELVGRAAPRAGDLQPSGLRDHRDGDGVRGIHWRASARRGRLVVQEWEGAGGRGLEVVLDRRCAADELDEALAAVSFLVALAREGKETLRVSSQGLSAAFGEGGRPWSEALRFLAGADLLPPDGPAPPPASPHVARLPRARSRG